MTHPLELSAARDFMKERLAQVFSTMLSRHATLAASQHPPKILERVSGSIGFGGDDLSGAVYLHLPAAFAARAAATMLGLPPEEALPDADVNDVVGEVSNMLAGGLKSWFCNAGFPCAISTPGIIRGASFEIEPMPGIQRTILVFECDGEPIVAEIHLKSDLPLRA